MGHRHKDNTHRHARFERMHTMYCGRIYNFVLKLTHGNEYMAEEITQIVFMKLWEKFDTVSDSESLRSYMFSIARNTLLNYLKHETIEYIYYNYLRDVSHEDHTTQDAIDSAFLNQYVSTLIDELPPVRQKVFRMSRIQYLTNRQIAQTLGISISTVETHLTLALKFMRQELKRRYGIICDFIIIATMLSCHI
ncbi:RNA polymerase sigma-70 factor [Muribaculum intestinale]|uniref:RNA polymerase sigma-70 factor n=1 Tax=Muribaculum intestinale TaxID=1796646 RepID=UPI0025A9F2C0|nr:RNA polymerase sigma-70 factor [Muribaculum intestinale]